MFVEPIETIEQNNELVRLLDEEQAEIHRILLEMTRRIGEHADAILCRHDVLAELELQFAKARFAEDYNCVPVTSAGTQAGNVESTTSHVGTDALVLRRSLASAQRPSSSAGTKPEIQRRESGPHHD